MQDFRRVFVQAQQATTASDDGNFTGNGNGAQRKLYADGMKNTAVANYRCWNCNADQSHVFLMLPVQWEDQLAAPQAPPAPPQPQQVSPPKSDVECLTYASVAEQFPRNTLAMEQSTTVQLTTTTLTTYPVYMSYDRALESKDESSVNIGSRTLFDSIAETLEPVLGAPTYTTEAYDARCCLNANTNANSSASVLTQLKTVGELGVGGVDPAWQRIANRTFHYSKELVQLEQQQEPVPVPEPEPVPEPDPVSELEQAPELNTKSNALDLPNIANRDAFLSSADPTPVINDASVSSERIKEAVPQPCSLDLGHPKGRMTPYAYYTKIFYKEQVRRDPSMAGNFDQFAQRCSEAWRSLDYKERMRFSDMAQRDRERYELATKSRPTAAEPSDPDKPKRPKTSTAARRDPNAPKRPSSSFFYFCNDERKRARGRHPHQPPGTIAKELGRMWSKLEDRHKRKYELLAEHDRQRYRIEMVEYQNRKCIAPPAGQSTVATNPSLLPRAQLAHDSPSV